MFEAEGEEEGMSYYNLTFSAYSDFPLRATMEGPEGADLPALLAAWVDHGPFLPGADDVEGFIAYLSHVPGWSERFPTEFSLGSYDMYEYMRKNKGSWPPEPDRSEPCPKWPWAGNSTFTHLTAHHAWDRGRDLEERKYWGCTWCGKEAT